jgi:hypothetical protein
MIELVAELCAAALLAGLTIRDIVVLFLASCAVMRTIACFEKVPRLPL